MPSRSTMAVDKHGEWNVLLSTVCCDVFFCHACARSSGVAQMMLVPSAFTVPTGKAHWEVLLRARAIETQSYVVASAQVSYSHIALRRTEDGVSCLEDSYGKHAYNLQPGLCPVKQTTYKKSQNYTPFASSWGSRRTRPEASKSKNELTLCLPPPRQRFLEWKMEMQRLTDRWDSTTWNELLTAIQWSSILGGECWLMPEAKTLPVLEPRR